MLTDEEMRLEEERFREKKIIAHAVKFHSKLVAQLFHGDNKGSPCLLTLDINLGRLEQTQQHGRVQRQRDIQTALTALDSCMFQCRELFDKLFQNTGPITLKTAESTRPLICPRETLRQRQALTFDSALVKEADLISKLVVFDELVRDALLLRQYGFIDETIWSDTIGKTTKQWRALFQWVKPIQ